MRLGAVPMVSTPARWIQERLNFIIGSRRAPLAVDGIYGPATISAMSYYLRTVLGVDTATGRLWNGEYYIAQVVTGANSADLSTPLKESLANGVGADGSRPVTPAPVPTGVPATREDIPIEYRDGSYSSGGSSAGTILLAAGLVGAIYFYSRMQAARPGRRGLRGTNEKWAAMAPDGSWSFHPTKERAEATRHVFIRKARPGEGNASPKLSGLRRRRRRR